ncbi:ANTAR domain-containing protein [Jatrophihabitans sp.]|uniref:ANTAR domain-containing protein n=1 Tax=Jatrophihabitans sp. TaxID=1932789 RepID=UPI002BCB8619|nr:ANTAR domain-containing protein [Jatrophihabitans sp.]
MPNLSTPLTELLAATVRSPLDSSAAELTALLHGLRAAPDPVPVFRSLTRLLVPRLCQAATVWISVDGQQPSAISCQVLGSSGHEPCTLGPDVAAYCSDSGAGGDFGADADSVVVPFSPPPVDAQRGYRGVLVMSFAGLRPTMTHVLIGHLLVDRAVGLVQREQLQAKIENLHCALNTNREIGTAMGVLMARHQLTAEQAFSLLRRASQHSHRKVVALAAEVVQTGMLELPEGVDLTECRPTPGPPAQRYHRPHSLRVAQ